MLTIDAKQRQEICRSCSPDYLEMIVSQNKGTPIQTSKITILFMGTPKSVPLILGNPLIMSGVPPDIQPCGLIFRGSAVPVVDHPSTRNPHANIPQNHTPLNP